MVHENGPAHSDPEAVIAARLISKPRQLLVRETVLNIEDISL
jgi:hypothetical protein